MHKLLALSALLLLSTSLAAKPAQRVIALAPHATELACAAGLCDQLIAVSAHSDYPVQVARLEHVSNYQGIKIERIIALKPDLIIAWPAGNPQRELDKLKQFGLRIYYSQTHTLEDIARNIEQLSEFSADPQVGKAAATHFRQQLAELKQRYQTATPVRYFYQLSEKPIITLAQGSWPSEVFRFCGGENVFERSATPYPQVGLEQVIVAKPEVIFTSEHAIENGNMWQEWAAQLPAVQNQHIWALNADWLNRPTPRTLNAIRQVCDRFDSVRQKR